MLRIASCLLVICQIIVHNSFQAEENPLIPREILFGNPVKSSPKISPDAKLLAYLAPNQHQIMNVWVAPIDNLSQAQCITNDEKRGIRSFSWQYDNQHILYVQDRDGDENWHLYQTDLQTKATRDLTPYQNIQAQVLEYNHDHPHEMLILLNKRDPANFDVYRLNLLTGDLTLNTENSDGVIEWAADKDLNVRGTLSYTTEKKVLVRVRDSKETQWREFMEWDVIEDFEHLMQFSPDGKSIILLTSLDSPAARIIQVDLASKQRKVIAEDPQFDIDNSSLLLHPSTHAIEAVRIEKEKPEWVLINTSLTQDFEVIKNALKTPFSINNRDLKDQKWVVVAVSDVKSPQYYLYDKSSKQLQFLFSSNPLLDDYSLNAMTPVSFQARDGMKLYSYLTLPKGDQKKLPTVLLVHGGPWVRDDWGYNPIAQWLSNRGYAVLQINYRGSNGYGKDYLNAGNREWAGKMHTDLLDGKQWMIQQNYADPDKVAIFGGSYGGYATLVGLTFTPDEFCCGVDIVGPSNLVTLLKTVPAYWIPLKAQFDVRLGKETEISFLESRSPLFRANEIKKPLLIAQGAHDPRVKQTESDQIVAEARKNGKPIEYLLFSDEGHGFAQPKNKFKFYAAAEDFLSKYLGGDKEAPKPEESWEDLKR